MRPAPWFIPHRHRWRQCTLLLAGVLTACALPTADVAPPDFPAAYYREARLQGRPVLEVDSRQSLVTIAVGRSGSRAHLGHDHLVASRDVSGYVAPDDGRADLHVPLERLLVDDDALLAAAGVGSSFSAAAVEGTRRNMLDRVLEAHRFPHALIRATREDGETLGVAITLHGATKSYRIPVRTETLPGGIAVSGKMEVKQSDFGIVPLSILGGSIQVRDRLDLEFRIVARGG